MKSFHLRRNTNHKIPPSGNFSPLRSQGTTHRLLRLSNTSFRRSDSPPHRNRVRRSVVVPVEPMALSSRKRGRRPLHRTPSSSFDGGHNEVGTLNRLRNCRICRGKKVVMHTDAVQMAGKLPIRVRELGVDLLSLSAHKIGGPKGVGLLYIRKGNASREPASRRPSGKNRRAGTETWPALSGRLEAGSRDAFLSEYKGGQLLWPADFVRGQRK